MDKEYYENVVLPVLIGEEGYHEEYSSAYEFKKKLNQDALAVEKVLKGWVFWREGQGSQKILNLLKLMASSSLFWWRSNCLIQFWGWEVEGEHHYLSTTNRPFFVTQLREGYSWYRKACIDVKRAGAEQLGGVGRAYRSKQPESPPDLRFYSDHEFALRLQAASSGFRAYLALPLFDLQGNEDQCFGVLEFLSLNSKLDILDHIPEFYENLELAGFRSTHRNHMDQEVDSEIKKTLELAIKAVPGLSLAQVWVPCKQCHHTSQCMESAYFASKEYVKDSKYRTACKLHTLQIDVNSNTILSHHSISKYPLAHYTQIAGLSLDYEIVLQSDSNHSYVIQFFIEPKYKEDSFMQVLGILKMKFQSFQLVRGGKLLEKSNIIELGNLLENSNTIERESIDMLESMASYGQIFSVSDFTEYLETGDICCSQSYSDKDEEYSDEDELGGRVFYSKMEQGPMEQKMLHFMEILCTFGLDCYVMVQFWAPIMIKGRRCLTTWDQPYALNCLAKGLASFRKECIKHLYFVDEESKEDELGPVGRVFRNGLPELLYDHCSYSAQEFPMRNYALHCGIRTYGALPVFDDKHECIGVIELIEWDVTDLIHDNIITALEEAELWPPNFMSYPTSMKAKIECWNIEAIAEIENAFDLIDKIPQCRTARVWVPFEKCSSNCLRCMKWLNLIVPEYQDHFDVTHVKPKNGMIGMVLESETKSCFFQDLSDFGIADRPLNHYENNGRSNSCFAICLQSSYTGDLLYVIEFFLYQCPTTYDYLVSFLKFLLPVLEHELESFKIASGKRVGEGELAVEVIEFSEASQLTFPESDQINEFPIKFKSVVYGQKEHEHIEKQQMQSDPEVGQSKEVDTSELKETKKGKRKTGIHLNLEILKPHFGKKLEDVADELGVGRSTIKRACRECGINRWPGSKKQAMNLSLFERESTQDNQHEISGPSSSCSLQVLDASLQQNTNTQHPLVEEEGEKVMIKVRYKKHVIKFQLRLSLGVVKLSEEVARRLNLSVGSFKLKYMDEDNDEILIACDEDLQLCPKVGPSKSINLFVSE